MSAIQDILNKNHFTEKVDGVEFDLRVITAEMSFRIIGAKTLGIIRGASSGNELSDVESLELMDEMMPKYLKMGMLSPKLGDVTDAERDIISLEDLGRFAAPVFSLIMKRSGYSELVNFQKSSGATKEEN